MVASERLGTGQVGIALGPYSHVVPEIQEMRQRAWLLRSRQQKTPPTETVAAGSLNNPQVIETSGGSGSTRTRGPPVLETGALPIELHACGGGGYLFHVCPLFRPNLAANCSATN
jgi:hypothetical protein